MIRLLTFLIALGTLAAQTASFPTVPTDADLLVALNRAETTLTSGVDASTLTLPVASTSLFSFTGSTIVTIGNERIRVCSASGVTMTVCSGGRGYDGSVAASHSSNAPVRAQVVAWFHNRMREEVQAWFNDYASLRAIVTRDDVNGRLGIGMSPTEKLDVAGTVRGQKLDTTGELRLNGSAGTSGQLVRSQGAGLPPVWAASPEGIPAGGAELQVLRKNRLKSDEEWATLPIVRAIDFAGSPYIPVGSLPLGPSTVLINYSSCPVGVSGNDYLHVMGLYENGVWAEDVTINGGTCRSGQSSGTIQFSYNLAYTNASLGSRTAGIREAIEHAAASGGGTVTLPGGQSILPSGKTIYIARDGIRLTCEGAGGSPESGCQLVTYSNATTVIQVGHAALAGTGVEISGITFTTPRYTITNLVNSGAGKVRVTLSPAEAWPTGSTFYVAAVQGSVEANGYYTVTHISGGTYDLEGTTIKGTWSAGTGYVYPVNSGAAVNVKFGGMVFIERNRMRHHGLGVYLEGGVLQYVRQNYITGLLPVAGGGIFINTGSNANGDPLGNDQFTSENITDLDSGVFSADYLIGAVANNGSGLARVTTTAAHGLSTGQSARISGISSVNVPNGNYAVTVISSTVVDLQGTAVSGPLSPAANTAYLQKNGACSPTPGRCEDQQPGSGMRLYATGGSFSFHDDFIHSGYGILVDPPTGSSVKWSRFSGVLADTSKNDGYLIQPNGGKVYGIEIDAPWATNSNGNGITVNEVSGGIVDGVRITAARIYFSGRHGVNFNAGDNLQITSSSVGSSSFSAASTYDGVFVNGGNTENVQISANRIGNQAGFATLPRRPVTVCKSSLCDGSGTASLTAYQVVLNQNAGNASGDIFDEVIGLHRVIALNTPPNAAGAPETIYLGDDRYWASLLSSQPTLNLDAGDYLDYQRSANALRLVVGGQVRLQADNEGVILGGDTAAEPTCNAARQGKVYFRKFGGASNDTMKVCRQASGGAYAWAEMIN